MCVVLLAWGVDWFSTLPPVVVSPYELAGSRFPQYPHVQFSLHATGLPDEGIWKSTPLLVDVNRDGLLDIVAHPRLGRGARVWVGTLAGEWHEASAGLGMPLSCGGGVATGDVNRDGLLDLVVADHCTGVLVYLGTVQGVWSQTVTNLNPSVSQQDEVSEEEDNLLQGAEDIALGDVNEDGWLDLVVTASQHGGFSVYVGDGSGREWQEVTSADGLPSAVDMPGDDSERGGWANRVLLHDVNGDGHLDVVASYYRGPRVWCGTGTALWNPCSQGLPTPEAGGRSRGLVVVDVNADGRLDLVVANVVDGLEIYLQALSLHWDRVNVPALSTFQGGAESVVAGDFSGDGHVDLLFSGRRQPQGDSGLFLLLGDGKLGWAESPQALLPAQGLPFVWGLAVGDSNRDGFLDIVCTTGLKQTESRVRLAAGLVRREGTHGPSPAEQKTPQAEPFPRIQVWHSARVVSQP